MLNDMEIELVRRFHESDLSEEELIVMNQRIDAEPDFKKEVERLGLVRDAIVRLVGYEQDIQLTPALTNGNNTVKKNKNKWFLPLGACLLLLVGCFTYYQYSTMQAKEQIFSECEAFSYSISSDIMRSENPNMETAILNEEDEAALQSIIDNYKNKDFAAAEREAVSLRNTSKDITAQEIVAWWMVTIYLKEGEKEKAKTILEDITNQPDFNSKSTALDMLESL